MKFLYILRHAKSSRDDPALTDHDRPLNAKGLKQSPIIGKLIKSENIIPDIIVSSTARRALETARIVAKSSGFAGDILENPKFYEADLDYVIKEIQKLQKTISRAMIVGHNPAWEELTFKLTGEMLPLSTCSIVEIVFDTDDWSQIPHAISGQIKNHFSPEI